MNRYKKPAPYPYVLCLIIVLFQCNMLYSQHYGAFGAAESKLPLVVQPSPNSASLARMTADNVNLYTGRLSVAVPIYTLKSRDLEVPISLQGNASGHKVNEYASWAGLGWSLNAGGSITRVMNNLPDEFTGTISSSSFNFPGFGYTKLKSLENVNVGLLEGPTYDFNRKKEIVDKGNWNVSSDKPSEGYDLQPDEFYFNFGKYSGKFVFDQDGKIYTVPKSNLVITPGYEVRDGNNKITSFTVTTDEGVQYQFGNYSLNAVEETKVSLNTDFARFYFEAMKSGVNYLMFNGKYVYNKEPRVATMIDPYATVALDFFGRNEETTELFYYPSTWHLTKISSPTGDNITLNYTDNGTLTYMSDRSFSGSMPNLDDDQVVVNGLNYGTQYVSPIEPVSAGPWFFKHYPSPQMFSVIYTNISLKSKRLVSIVTDANDRVNFEANTMREDLPGDRRLDKIVVVNRSNSVLKEYKLDYDIRYGADGGNLDEIEEFTFRFYGLKQYFGSGGQGVTSYDYSQLYNEVKYFHIPLYCRKRMFLKTVQESGGGISLPPWKFEYNATLLPFRGSNAQDYFGYATVNTSMHPFPDLSYKFTLNGEPETVPDPGSYPLFSFKVTNFTNPPPIIGANANKNYNLQRMQAGVITKITYPTGGYKTFEYEFNGEAKAWNGLRVSSIKEYESAAASPNIKNYTYGTFYKTDEYLTKHQMHERALDGYFDDRVFWSSRNVNPDNGQGSAGGYDYVEIKQPGHGRYRVEFSNTSHLGYEDRKNFVHGLSTLLNPNEQALATDISPFPAATSFDYRRGLPLEEYTYDESNKLLKRTSYVYDYSSVNVNDKVIPGAMVTKIRFNYSKGNWDWFLFGKYNYYVQWMALATKIDKVYAADGDVTHYAETREDYTQVQPIINNQEFMFPKTIKTKKPGRNEELITQNAYVWDFPFSTPFDEFDLGLLNLTFSNAPAKTVEQMQYLQNPDGSNKRLVAGTINKYNSTGAQVKQAYSLKLAAPLDYNAFMAPTQVNGTYTFDLHFMPAAGFEYGPKGNMVEQREGENMKQAFIWDDNNVYPIAKVINASASDCAYTSWEEGALNGNWTQSNLHFDDNALTGKRGGNAGWSTLTKTGLDPAKTYIVSFWTNHASVSVNGTSVNHQPGTDVLGWNYCETTVSGVSQVVINGAFGTIDEIRLYPKSAQMITYVNEPLVGVTTETDANSRIRRYEYDGLQRLSIVKDENKNIIKTFDYNYITDNAEPMWQGTTEKRCSPCPQNGNYHTPYQEVKQVDANPNSPTYKSERWYNIGETGACTVQPDWQNTSGPTCLLNSNGFNTGIQRIVQKNMNPCSDSYNQTRNIDQTDYTLCPSNEPNYQPLEEYRCQPCLANGAYTNKIQERKWQDMNPNSATSGNIQWRTTGAQCANQPDWQNTATGARCMLNQMNLPVGYLEREKRDLNPCSDTYNQVIWMQDAASSSCQKVYVFIDYEDYRATSPSNGGTNDIWVRFYYDENRTQPANVANATITIVETHQSGCGDYNLEQIFNNVNGQALKLYEDVLSEYELPDCYVYVNFASKY